MLDCVCDGARALCKGEDGSGVSGRQLVKVVVEVINQRVWVRELRGYKRHKGHGGSPFSVVLAASRSLASASILLKLRSSTGLINTLKKTINPSALPIHRVLKRRKENNRDRDEVRTCLHLLRGTPPGPTAGHSPSRQPRNRFSPPF